MAEGKTLEELLEAALRRMVDANAKLARIVDGKTLYEHSPSLRGDANDAWLELDDAVKQAKVALLAAQINRDPDVDDSAGRPLL